MPRILQTIWEPWSKKLLFIKSTEYLYRAGYEPRHPDDQTGLYECVITAPGTALKTNNLFEVSRLAAVSRSMQNGNTEVLVTDYLSGKPITDASVTYYSGKRREMQPQGTVKQIKTASLSFHINAI